MPRLFSGCLLQPRVGEKKRIYLSAVAVGLKELGEGLGVRGSEINLFPHASCFGEPVPPTC